MNDALVLSLFDRTGNMVRPWAEAGYDCIAVDIQTDGVRVEEVGSGTIRYVEADITEYIPPRAEYQIAFAFPPCTNLAVSGARWFQEKGIDGLSNGLQLVERARRMLEWTGAPWMLENPVSVISSYWREPDYTFHPYEYDGFTDQDNAYSKKTCLWTSDGFTMPDSAPADEYDDRIHQLGPSKERGDIRAETPLGFARAVFEANAPDYRSDMPGVGQAEGAYRSDVNANAVVDGGIIPGKEGVVLTALRTARQNPTGFRLSDVSKHTDVSDTTVRRVLNTLQDARVLDRRENGRLWYRGPAANDLLGAPMPQ